MRIRINWKNFEDVASLRFLELDTRYPLLSLLMLLLAVLVYPIIIAIGLLSIVEIEDYS